MRFFLRKNSESGQILLIVILAAVISLTVGLSVASRVITNTKVTTDEVNAQKALSAAEAGVEEQIQNPVVAPTPILFGNKSTVTSTSKTITASQFLINGGNLVSQDEGMDIWLSDYPGYTTPRNMNLKIYWADSTSDANKCSSNPAIELVVLSGSANSPANVTLSRTAYETCSSRTSPNHFTDPVNSESKNISGIVFNHSAVVSVTSGLIARVIPLYADTKIAVEMFQSGSFNVGLSNPPAQGTLIQATGTSGNVTRTLRVFQGYPKLPTEFFPYSLFIP